MKTLIQLAVAVAAVCLLAGCETTGLSPRETSGVGYPNYILSLQSGGTNTPQRIHVPIRLAVAQVGEAAPPDAMIEKLSRQTALVTSVDALPLPGDTENFQFYARAAVPVDYTARAKALCSLARTTGADYVFLFGGDIDSWQENNSLSALDATIVGGAIFPGTKIHAEGRAAGVLVSTTTCQPVLFVNADTRGSAMSPDYFVDGKKVGLRAKVRDELIDKLNDQFIKKLSDLSDSETTRKQ